MSSLDPQVPKDRPAPPTHASSAASSASGRTAAPGSGSSRRHWWSWAAGAAGLLVVGAVVFTLLQQDAGQGAEEAEPVASTPTPTSIVVEGFDVDAMNTPSDADLAQSVRVLNLNGSVRSWVETEDNVTTISTDVLFEFAKADIDAAGERAIVEAVKQVPNGASVDVLGYTDSKGTDEINMPLSQERADAVAAVISRERPDLKVNAVGKGSQDPVARNTNSDGSDNPEGRAKNRRVEISYS